MKKFKAIMAVVFIIVVIVFASVVSSLSSKNKDNGISSSQANDIISKATEESKKVKASEEVSYNNISVDQYLNLYAGSDSALVLIGNSECHYCQIAEPILKHLAYLYNLTINYLDTDTFSKEDNSKLLNSDTFFQNGIGTPLILIVKNSTIVGHVDGLNISKNYITFFKTYGLIGE